jgi:hypothetical protein
MTKLNQEDVSMHLLFELKYNYGVTPDEELKHVFLMEKKEFVAITSKRVIIHTGELHHVPKNLKTELLPEYEENTLKNLELFLEEEEKRPRVN